MNRQRTLSLFALLWVFALLCTSNQALAIELHPALFARQLIVELKLEQAEKVLNAVPVDDTAAAIERGRLALYATRYEQARKILERKDVAATPQGKQLGELARNCERSMAGAFVVHDVQHNVIVRMQDERDQVLVPLIASVIESSRKTMREGLGIELPSPMRVELVRDHFSLSSITGLPEEAARTTGTVAIANWGRVAMLTPRAIGVGYPWLDTLAHELTHVALGMGTRDRAPLWFQEGVAKYFETRWRRPDPFDAYPSPDNVAAEGFKRGLALEFDNLGPSLAMLPTPQQATIVYAEVESFVGYLVNLFGEQLLVELTSQIHSDGENGINTGLLSNTGKDLASWKQAWRKTLEASSTQAPEELFGTKTPNTLAARNVRLGKLLLERGHSSATLRLLEPAMSEVPDDLQVSYLLGKAHMQAGALEQAWKALERVTPTSTPHAGAFALRGRLLADRNDSVGAEVSFFRGMSLDPWNEEVACEMLPSPHLPREDYREWPCLAARAWPRY